MEPRDSESRKIILLIHESTACLHGMLESGIKKEYMKERKIIEGFEPLPTDDLPEVKRFQGSKIVEEAESIVARHLHLIAIEEDNPVYQEMLLVMQAEAVVDKTVREKIKLFVDFIDQLQRLLDVEKNKNERAKIKEVMDDTILQLNAYLLLEDQRM